MNRLPVLHTKSSKINFLTVQTGETRNTQSITKGLKAVINTYTTRGFTITDLHGDNEFDITTLKSELQPINTRIYGTEEHVGVIERSVQTVKEQCRALCHSLPYKRYTKLIVHSLVENSIYWLNSFPSADGAHNHLSLATIVLGRGKLNFSKKHIAFGLYALTFNGTENNMKGRNTPCIALKPSNKHRGAYFMSLVSGKKIHAYQWTELPITDNIIDRVHELAEEKTNPSYMMVCWFLNGALILQWWI